MEILLPHRAELLENEDKKEEVKEPRYNKKDQVLLTFIEPWIKLYLKTLYCCWFFSVTLTNGIFLLLFFNAV